MFRICSALAVAQPHNGANVHLDFPRAFLAIRQIACLCVRSANGKSVAFRLKRNERREKKNPRLIYRAICMDCHTV